LNRLGLIGCGAIGGSLVSALAGGALDSWCLTGLLTRTRRTVAGVQSHTDPAAFFADEYDLIVEAAGPRALADLGTEALRHAPVWTVNAVALADDDFRALLTATAAANSNRLRVLPGSIAAVDALKAVATDPDARLEVFVEMPANTLAQAPFSGSAREAAGCYPNDVNIAVAAALAGPGLDRTRVHVTRHCGTGPRRIRLVAVSRSMRVESVLMPLDVKTEPHPVAAALVAALSDVGRHLVVF
jgi:aspartate dehydrogenase